MRRRGRRSPFWRSTGPGEQRGPTRLPDKLRTELDEAGSVPPRSVYRMFTPDYQNRLVSPGAKAGDKPSGYAPAVRNWVPERGA
ncbi:hypothetical protein [Nonomuraea solani]|uniref:hypothetical protein n=1 Tax=Nonomuraea solani TaxID=1144553 RepID=UPI00190E960A|nr:hypothetical protein [Nonomuraea solani]